MVDSSVAIHTIVAKGVILILVAILTRDVEGFQNELNDWDIPLTVFSRIRSSGR